jgi:tetratricopeptide (TPR) repeat protein
MINPNQPNDPTTPDRKRRLDVIQVKLRSQRPSDIFSAILDVKKLLQDNPEDQEIYEILLDAVRDNPGLRPEVRTLLDEMIQKGSKSAAGALRVLPADVKDLMADADDAYYMGEYEQAIELYQKVLKIDPDNVRAREQTAKAELNRIAGRPDNDLPRAAVQYFRRARSHIAARDFGAAMNLLSAALEAARASGQDFPEAESLLNSMQDLWTADEYKAKAEVALRKEQWGTAYDLYNKAYLLNPQDQVTKELLTGLDGLMRADALLDSLSNQSIGDKEYQEKLAKIDGYLKTAEEIKALVGTSLLKSCRARYNQHLGKGLKSSHVPRQALAAIILLLLFLSVGTIVVVWEEMREINHATPPTNVATANIVINSTSTPKASPIPPTPVPFKPTQTAVPATPTSILHTATDAFTPTLPVTLTATPIAYGKLKLSAYYFADPRSGTAIDRVGMGQEVAILDQQTYGDIVYFLCSWEKDGKLIIGWINRDNINIP